MITKYVLALVAILFLPLTLFSQTYSGPEKEILEMQDRRTIGEEDLLIKYLHSTDRDLRIRAIYALANIGDSNYISEINYLLAGPFENYPTQGDIKAIAFMLGQIPSRQSIDMLEFMLNNSSTYDDSSKADIIDALGKIGDGSSLEKLLNAHGSHDSGQLKSAIAMSIGRFALRKIKSEKAVEILKAISSSGDSIAMRNSAFAFWRIGDRKLLEPAKQEIYDAAESKDAQTRMWGFNALGKLQDPIIGLYTIESFNSEKDWRVKVNMLNSLTNYDSGFVKDTDDKILYVIGDYKNGENENLSVVRLNVLGKIFAGKKFKDSADIRNGLIEIINSNEYGTAIRSEASNSLALIFKDNSKEDLFNAFSNTNDYRLKSSILKSFGNFEDGNIYREVRDSVSAEVQRYNAVHPNTTGLMIGSNDLAELYRGFVDMLSALDEKVDAENRNTIRLMLTEFVGSKDIVIVDACLTALQDSIYLDRRDETVSVLKFDFDELEYPKDTDVLLAFIYAFGELRDSSFTNVLNNSLSFPNYEIAKASADALQKISWKEQPVKSVPWSDYDWSYIESLPEKRYVKILTSKGDIRIEMFPTIAPFTVMNFLKLAERKYFNGTVFHRVVPNFVIQGGDPTGTGYGGPGYSIRSELSPLTYETGIVGMASSGKDTEGSQFFITHSAAPHLDGRYTIFGKVTDGMDVVDKIVIGDEINSIIIE